MPKQADAQPTDPTWAWAVYRPSDAAPWNLARAAHLYRRAAFGADWGQLQQALSLGPQRTIDQLLRPEDDPAPFNRQLDTYETSGSPEALRAWWLRRMIQTPHPLLEKMTLFWHGHFAADAAKVKSGRLMKENVQLLRSRALGSFETMLQGICRDPAMLLSVGAQANRKAAPNENFAGPLLEVFTVGPGRFTENDVHETARAFTGWFVLRNRLRYIEREFDATEKQIFGQKGVFHDADVVRIILEQPPTAQMVVRKLYRFFISETQEPNDKLIAPLAQSFAEDYDVGRLVEKIIRSNLFFSPAAYRRRIKPPVDFALNIIKGLEQTVSTTQLAGDLADLGQNLYHPPTIRGWAGGKHWINTSTITARNNLALALLQGSGPYGKKLNPWTTAQKHGAANTESAEKFLLELFVQADLEDEQYKIILKTVGQGAAERPESRLRKFAHTVTTLAEFNLA
jgi:uncharacterized protein (DUF1800 family)